MTPKNIALEPDVLEQVGKLAEQQGKTADELIALRLLQVNGTAAAINYGFAGAGKAAELAISHFPPCLTKVLM